MKILPLFVLAAAFAGSSCLPDSELKSINVYTDPVIENLADYQDKRLTDSLRPFLKHENPVYRKRAAFAFASVQDTMVIDALSKLLSDSDAGVRQSAALALGQTRSDKAAAALEKSISTEQDSAVLRELFEAYGKISPKPIESLNANAGQSWMLYRMMLNGHADTTSITAAIPLLDPKNNDDTRLGASQFFARNRYDITAAQDALIAATGDRLPEVRMAATFALRKLSTPATLSTLTKLAEEEPDYRVRVSVAIALQKFPFEQSSPILIKLLNDENVNVGIASSEVIKASITRNLADAMIDAVSANKSVRIQANVYEAVLSVNNNPILAAEIQSRFQQSKNVYDQAALLSALGQFTPSYEFIFDVLSHTDVPVLKSTAASALVSINHNKDFTPELKKQFATLYIKAIELGDPAVIGIISAALSEPALDYKSSINDWTFLQTAKAKLVLPKDNETLQSLEAAIAFFEDKKVDPVRNAFNHPIDWSLIHTISDDQQVLIKTSKGEIVLQLFVNEAPGSVANFVTLVNQHYFDGKVFHRVVPNFVIQAGCNRGDGWGSEDYSIRSEFSHRRYTTGSVGMASAGKDTEGTQWFITHSPTPHLDGRYTIFAEVTKGMEVVHRIEVGDLILEARLINSTGIR